MLRKKSITEFLAKRVDLLGLLFTKISKVVSKVCPPQCHDIMQREWRTPPSFLKFDCWIEIQNFDRISIEVLARFVFSKPCRKYTKRVLRWTGTDSSQFSEKIGTTVPISRNIAALSRLRCCSSAYIVTHQIVKVVGFVGLQSKPVRPTFTRFFLKSMKIFWKHRTNL